MKKSIKMLVIFIISSSVLLTTFSLYIYQIFKSPNFLINKPIKSFTISYNSTFQDIKFYFHKKKYINNLISFSFLSKLLNYNNKIVFDLYQLKTNMNNLNSIKLLKNKSKNFLKVSFSRIKKKVNIFFSITKNIGFSFLNFIFYLNQLKFIKNYGFNFSNILFIFILDLKKILWVVKKRFFFDTLLKNYNKLWNKKKLLKVTFLNFNPIEIFFLFFILKNELIKEYKFYDLLNIYVNKIYLKKKLNFLNLYFLKCFSIKRVLNKYQKIKFKRSF